MNRKHEGLVAVVYRTGFVKFIDTDSSRLQADLIAWKSLFPSNKPESWKINSQERYNRGPDGTSKPRTGLNTPKHGKEDPKNEIHVGGNTWAGNLLFCHF